MLTAIIKKKKKNIRGSVAAPEWMQTKTYSSNPRDTLLCLPQIWAISVPKIGAVLFSVVA